jgi:hypothetical protein
VTVTDIADLERLSSDKDLRRLYLYWRERCGARTFPSRDDIDPVEFGYALGRVSLIDVVDDPPRFYYRLVSTQITRHLGYEMTGKFVDQMPEPEMRDFAERHYRRALAAAAPLYESDEVVLDGRRWRHESLALPLSSNGQAITMLLVYRTTAEPVTVRPGRR